MHAATKGRAKTARSTPAERPTRKARGTRSDVRVAVADEQSLVEVDADQLAEVVRLVLAGEGIAAAEISLAIVDDATIHTINRDFLQHDFATDVITFALGDEGGPVEGEIVASAETARTVAAGHGVTAADELLLYVIHGVLHLAGYDDLSPAPRRQMRAREQHYLAELGIELAPVETQPRHRSKQRTSRGVRGGKSSRRSTNGTQGASTT